MRPQLLSQVAIECMLSKGNGGLDGALEGDGCVYDLSAPHQQISTPDKLRAGDYVKIRLWIPDEDSHISIDLAEVQWTKSHWIKVDIVLVSPEDQARLNRFNALQQPPSLSCRATNQILIRA